jgi:hypothetical protein
VMALDWGPLRIEFITISAAANPETPTTETIRTLRNQAHFARRELLCRSNRALRAATNRGGGSMRIRWRNSSFIADVHGLTT